MANKTKNKPKNKTKAKTKTKISKPQHVVNLDSVFNPKSIAIIGASREPGKIGNVIVKNFVDGSYKGKVFPINPKADQILGLKCYPDISAIKEKVDSVIIATPAQTVPAILKSCGQKGVKSAVIITGGFSEVGNTQGEEEIRQIAKEYSIAVIGPNCMGCMNLEAGVDSVFLPTYKLGRPVEGEIGFITQSGAVGGCVLDLAARAGIGMSKFVSYGNAAVIDETSLLEYFEHDKSTKVIVMYLEGVQRGRDFLEVAKRVTKTKPVIVLKAGVGKKGSEAAKSHTAALAGSAEAYHAAFKQAKIIEARTLTELFDFSKIFYQPYPCGNRVAVITNGGGLGVLSADSAEEYGLQLTELSDETKKALREKLPSYANVRNPLDLIGDANAERYELAIDLVSRDRNVDILAVIVLFQTASLDSKVVDVIVKQSDKREKPMVVISVGGEYTDLHKRILDGYKIPTYHSPSSAMKAIRRMVDYSDSIGTRSKDARCKYIMPPAPHTKEE
ncbi:Acetate--CoA ligase [ADP-forming] I [Candidatus Gugararchaeum adminiculabundum]|nr:Acetate--CoA ligase [ADP-forming] I [Candidatus Gugararchaeum adminiculabundum]